MSLAGRLATASTFCLLWIGVTVLSAVRVPYRVPADEGYSGHPEPPMKGLCSAAKYQSFGNILVAGLSPMSLTQRLQSYCVMDHSPAPGLMKTLTAVHALQSGPRNRKPFDGVSISCGNQQGRIIMKMLDHPPGRHCNGRMHQRGRCRSVEGRERTWQMAGPLPRRR